MLALRVLARPQNLRLVSTWSAVPAGPPDAILGMYTSRLAQNALLIQRNALE